MGLFKKKSDPISERSKELNARIAALEQKVKQLHVQSNQGGQSEATSGSNAAAARVKAAPNPPLTAIPVVPAVKPPLPPILTSSPPPTGPLPSAEAVPESPLYNDLGVRKYNLAEAMHRLLNHFKGSQPTNPKLVNYLAAGNIQGLKPLRYEKRVARNRFIFLVVLFTLFLWAILAMMLGRH